MCDVTFPPNYRRRFSDRYNIRVRDADYNNNNNLFNIHLMFKNTTDLQPNTL